MSGASVETYVNSILERSTLSTCYSIVQRRPPHYNDTLRARCLLRFVCVVAGHAKSQPSRFRITCTFIARLRLTKIFAQTETRSNIEWITIWRLSVSPAHCVSHCGCFQLMIFIWFSSSLVIYFRPNHKKNLKWMWLMEATTYHIFIRTIFFDFVNLWPLLSSNNLWIFCE